MSDSFTATLARMPELERRIVDRPDGFRILTGERPTGRLHLGVRGHDVIDSGRDA